MIITITYCNGSHRRNEQIKVDATDPVRKAAALEGAQATVDALSRIFGEDIQLKVQW